MDNVNRMHMENDFDEYDSDIDWLENVTIYEDLDYIFQHILMRRIQLLPQAAQADIIFGCRIVIVINSIYILLG